MWKLLLSILFVLTVAGTTSARGWRGIVPLHSTRADIELLLGKPSPGRNDIYNTDKEFVRIDYAKGPCDGWPRGWNVPADTVLALSVGSPTNQLFSDLHIDVVNFSKAYDDAFYTYYANRAEGIEYIVSSEGVLSDTRFFPAAQDSGLRCNCFPAEDGSIFRGEIWDRYEGIPMEYTLGRLDNFAIQLSNSPPDWKGHVITYSPLSAGRAGAESYRKRIRNWLIVKRQMDPRRLVVVNGGHREEFAGELFLLSPGVTPPTPFPTLGSCDPKRAHQPRRPRPRE